jgi:ribosome maturation factor RimP
MITAEQVRDLVSGRIEGSELFLVDVIVKGGSNVRVLVDSMEGVKIEECAGLSRWLTAELDLIDDDHSLEVSSPGLDTPLMLRQQYEKNIGREVEVVFNDGKKKKGTLLAVNDEGIRMEVSEKSLTGGSQKKKKYVPVEKEYTFNEMKSTKVIISF